MRRRFITNACSHWSIFMENSAKKPNPPLAPHPSSKIFDYDPASITLELEPGGVNSSV